jgi:hypothetical protein
MGSIGYWTLISKLRPTGDDDESRKNLQPRDTQWRRTTKKEKEIPYYYKCCAAGVYLGFAPASVWPLPACASPDRPLE